MHPHKLRYTFVTTMPDAGVSLRDVWLAARHTDPRMTFHTAGCGRSLPTRRRVLTA